MVLRISTPVDEPHLKMRLISNDVSRFPGSGLFYRQRSAMRDDAQAWIEKLHLTEHPEGGYFAPAYRSTELLKKGCLPDRFTGNRVALSSIYYLLKREQFSTFHRLKSFEQWNFYAGSTLTVTILEPGGSLVEKKLGRDLEKGESLQIVVEPGCWFGARLCGAGEFALVGCTVVPGFEWEDMEFADPAELNRQYPGHREIIKRMTR
ncbi:MAG: cupin domain-containing protein [Syntrophobacteraceae bacterium]